MTTVHAPAKLDAPLADLAKQLINWLETGVRPDTMFATDVFTDLTVPQWRLQAEGPNAAFQLREGSHPYSGTVRVEALDRTSRGFLIQFEERWEDGEQHWYCRELIHCVVTADRISELTIYCTGDWDENTQQRHAEQVRLIRG
jgi:hypothetical protein